MCKGLLFIQKPLPSSVKVFFVFTHGGQKINNNEEDCYEKTAKIELV